MRAAFLVLMVVVMHAAPVRAELLMHDSAAPGQQVAFGNGLPTFAWFASSFEIPDEWIPYQICYIHVWIGPDGMNIFFPRIWEESGEADPGDKLWDPEWDAFQFMGSRNSITALDLRERWINLDSRHIRVGFQHTEVSERLPTIASDADGITPGVNHIKVHTPEDPPHQAPWRFTEDLPEDSRPAGDWILRLEIAPHGEACQDQPQHPMEVGIPEGGPEQVGPEPPPRDAGVDRPPPADLEDTGPPMDVGGRDVDSTGFAVESVIPASVPAEGNPMVAIVGGGFTAGARVELHCRNCSGPADHSAFQVQVRSRTVIVAKVPAVDMAPALYDVQVILLGDRNATLPGGLDVTEPGCVEESGPRLVELVPDSARAGERTSVTLIGSGFEEGAQVDMGELRLDAEVLGSDQALTTIPASVAPGSYLLALVNPDGSRSNPLSFQIRGEEDEESAGCNCRTGNRRGPGPFSLLLLLFLVTTFRSGVPGR